MTPCAIFKPDALPEQSSVHIMAAGDWRLGCLALPEDLKTAALSHHRTLLALTEVSALVPLRFNPNVEPASLAALLAEETDALECFWQRVHDAVEMVVRLDVLPGAAGRKTVSGQADNYLRQKAAQLRAQQAQVKRASDVLKWLAEQLAGTVRDSQFSLRTAPLGGSSSFLVARGELKEFHACLRPALARLEQDMKVRVLGAWPPYSFTLQTQELQMKEVASV